MPSETIWYTRCPVPNAFSIALHLGWLDRDFAHDGIRLKSLASSRDPVVRQAHFDHSLPNFIRHGGNIPPILSRGNGQDVKVVALSHDPTRDFVLALPESGIRTVRDLRGKRIGIPRRHDDPIDFWYITALRAIDLILADKGLPPDAVTRIELPVARRQVEDSTNATGEADSLWDARAALGFQREALSTLVRGGVDAIYAHGAKGALAQYFVGAQPVEDIPPLARHTGSEHNRPFTLTVSGNLLTHHPLLVTRLLRRVADAADWARDNERAAKRIIAAETGIPEELVDHAYGSDVHAQLGIDFADAHVDGLAATIADTERRGFLAAPFALADFLAPAPLAGAFSHEPDDLVTVE